jgi:acetyl esterase/lipase
MPTDTGKAARKHLLGASAAVALSISANSEISAQPFSATAPEANAGAATNAADLSLESTIADLFRQPLLQGFVDHILPWAGRDYDPAMKVSQFAQLLPYHSEVRPQVVLEGINRIIADRRAGKPVFHEIYSQGERKADPSLDEAGLFFFAGAPGAPFAIVAPGGGFSYVGSIHEGFPYAQEISAEGFNAFVLTYRTGQGGQIATQDLARAIDHVMDHANELNVAPDGYSLWGSSAGARMAASIGSHGPQAFGAKTEFRPATVVMAYTSHSDVGAKEPPTYVVAGSHDGIAPPAAMKTRAHRVREGGSEIDISIISGLGHGFGSGAGTEAEGWIADAIEFWRQNIYSASE